MSFNERALQREAEEIARRQRKATDEALERLKQAEARREREKGKRD